jgi:hypothetical protein
MHMASASNPPLPDTQAEVPRIKLVRTPKIYRLFIQGSREDIYLSDFQSLRGRALRSFDLICSQDFIRDLAKAEEQCHPCL